MTKEEVKEQALALGLSGELVPLSSVRPNPKNPRVMRDGRFEKLKQSIREFPKMLALRPMVTEDDGMVLGGNMRQRALKALGYGWIPKEWVKKASDLTEDERRRFIAIDNESFGEWDMDALANEWDTDELKEWGVDIPAWDDVAPTGYGNDADEADNVNEDDFDPDSHYETKVKAGEVWQLGEHRLMCGDSTDADAVAKLMNGERADLWITDPPYNVAYEGGTEEKLTIQNDNMSDSKFLEFLTAAYKAASDNMKEGAGFYIWHADLEGYNFRAAAKAVGLLMKQLIIWNKNALVVGRQDYQVKHEPCLYGWKPGAAHHWYSDRKQTTVIDFDKPMRNGEHPTMKPVGLFGQLIANSSRPGNIILDTFGGSGTTMIACEQLGRKCRMMELDPHYCTVIIARWEKLTGKQAVRLSADDDLQWLTETER